MKNIFKILFYFTFLALLSSTGCKYYTRDVLFKTTKHELDSIRQLNLRHYEKNYVIRKNDQIEFGLFTNKGEILIDPTSEFAKQASSGGSGVSSSQSKIKYTVQYDGKVNLPLLGKIKIDSLTIHELDSVLALKYSKYYLEPFVISNVAKRKLYILGMGQGAGGGLGQGGGGGGGQGDGGVKEFQMTSENMNLLEVLATNNAIGMYSKTSKIKIIRGDIKNPQVTIVDISTLSATFKSDLRVYPNDIIYIEPGRRPVIDFFREISFISQFAFAMTSIYFVISQVTK